MSTYARMMEDLSLPHQVITETRSPLFEFESPELFGGQSYALYSLSPLYWIEVLVAVCLGVVLAAVTGAIVYVFIVGPKDYESPRAIFLGFGILLPFWLLFPSVVIQAFGIENFIFRFVIGSVTPTISLFRLTEAIFCFCPPVVTNSMTDFVVYFASVLTFERDKAGRLIPTNLSIVLGHLRHFFVCLVVTGALQSFTTSYTDLNVFGPPIEESDWKSLERFGTWELYANSFVQASMFQMYLVTYVQGLTFFWHVVTRCQTKQIMRNPLFGSQSPSDFWSRRWNLLIQGVLKGGVFKPTRKYFGKAAGVCATFIASGLFHEWLVCNIFWGVTEGGTRPDCETTNCVPIHSGGAMIFFTWQAGLLVLEPILGNILPFQWLSKNAPSWLKTFLVLAAGVPMAHFFTEPYVRSNFFQHGSMGLPMIIRIES